MESIIKGCESDKRCFIVGTGSSINKQNLLLLKNECVIGISGLFCHKDIDSLSPKYYVNPAIFSRHGHVTTEENHIARLRSMDNALDAKTIMFFDKEDQCYLEKYNLFQDKKIVYTKYTPWNGEVISDIDLQNLPDISSVSETAIEIALYLGFREIILIGFDHDWYDGAIIHFDTREYNKFSGMTSEKMVKEYRVDSEFQMRRHAKMFAKYKALYALHENIYNANADEKSYVDTFPKVIFEELFSENVEHVLKCSKDSFFRIESALIISKIKSTVNTVNTGIVFSRQFNQLYDRLEEIIQKDVKVVIYGYGKIGKIIEKFMQNNIIAFVDLSCTEAHLTVSGIKIYPVQEINTLNYEKILISVAGREEIIKQTLIEQYGINNDDIYYIL